MANGIPPLLNQIANVTNTVQLLVADAQIAFNLFSGPKWGIGQNGFFSIVPDSVLSVAVKRDWQLPNYPQEEGAFQSYNKVTMPFDARVSMSKGGSDADRAAFLATIDSMSESTELYDVVMPELIMQNANIVHYDYRRTSTNGIGLLTVDLWLLEIRVAPSPAFTNTAKPSGADAQQGGMVQPQNPAVGTATLFGPNTVIFQ